jgi:carbonic anhydrase/acetyltransferase-like protein (isoleucine patch superfamily)
LQVREPPAYAGRVVVRTIADSVPRVDAPPVDVADLEGELGRLRDRFPGVVFDRYLESLPAIGERVHIAPGAAIVGAVELADDVSIWYGAILRGDVNRVRIGARSNLQDGVVVHLGDRDPTVVGEDVVVGHRAVLHGCHIESDCLIGIQSTILDGARIGTGSVVGAGALVTAGSEIPPRSLVLGTPGKVVRTLSPSDAEFHRELAAKYVRLAHNHRRG